VRGDGGKKFDPGEKLTDERQTRMHQAKTKDKSWLGISRIREPLWLLQRSSESSNGGEVSPPSRGKTATKEREEVVRRTTEKKEHKDV